MHSAWLDPSSTVTLADLAQLTRDAGLQVVPFGAPLATPQGRSEAPRIVGEWLTLLGSTKAIAEFNTLVLPLEQQRAENLVATFSPFANALRGHANVMLAVGANEPLTKGRSWDAATAQNRVREEDAAWHQVSDVPFCHKFTLPRVNPAGLDWAALDALWAQDEDAICYDWYPGSGDDAASLQHLRDVGQRLGKPVHILETSIPGDSPAALRSAARGLASLSIYQLLGGGAAPDPNMALWTRTPQGFAPEAGARMLRDALADATAEATAKAKAKATTDGAT